MMRRRGTRAVGGYRRVCVMTAAVGGRGSRLWQVSTSVLRSGHRCRRRPHGGSLAAGCADAQSGDPSRCSKSLHALSMARARGMQRGVLALMVNPAC